MRMVSYNGAAAHQVASILDEFGRDDESIIVDDCSTDGTVSTLPAIGDPRIRLLFNKRNHREVYSVDLRSDLTQAFH